MVTDKYWTANNKILKGEGPDKYQDSRGAIFLFRLKAVQVQKTGAALSLKLCGMPKAEIYDCAAKNYFKFISKAYVNI